MPTVAVILLLPEWDVYSGGVGWGWVAGGAGSGRPGLLKVLSVKIACDRKKNRSNVFFFPAGSAL